MTTPTLTPTPAQAVVPTDAAIDELATQWSSGPPVVLCHDGEGRPIDGWEFSIPRFRSAIRAALAALVQPPEAPAAVTALRMAVERHMTCRFYFGSTVAQATVPGGPAVYETVENHADPLAGACQAIAQAAAKIDAATPAPQVPSEAARLVGGEAALVAQAQALIAQIVEVAGEHTPMGKALSKLSPIIAALASAQAAPTDATGEPDMRLRNLQTWLVCREIGNALAPSLETVQGWLAALGDITGEAPPDFVMKAPKRDNSRCKFAAGGACCSSHCGDPACLASTLPTATDAQGVGEAPKAVAAGEPTIIGLDYDGTITRDPDMWHAVMKLMQSRGHEVHIVTMRHGVESTMGHAPMEQRFLDDADGVHFTGNSETGDRDAKRPHMDAKGIGVHVWIDDNPKAVHMSAREIWGWCTNPGDPMIHSAPEAGSPTASTTAGLTEAEPEPMFYGTWHHGNGNLCCGSMRYFRADFDTMPAPEVREAIFDWVCTTMNAALGRWRDQKRVREDAESQDGSHD